MSTSTLTLHRALIRLAKGMVTAWEKWVEEQPSLTQSPN